MKLTPLGIEGAWLAESPVWTDERGFFREWFKAKDLLAATGIHFSPQQANISQSQRGVIRGIHYSLAPLGQAKWVTCASGAVIDVIVDIRPNSPTFKKNELIRLDASNQKSLLVGNGLGHGYISLSDNSIVSYLLSSEYNPSDEYEVNFFDQDLNIDISHILLEMEPCLSDKDRFARSLNELEKQNLLPNYHQRKY